MRISDWSSDVCSSDLDIGGQAEPLYVVRLDAAAKQVIVGPRRALAVTGARLGEANWLAAVEGRPVLAKVRSMAKPVPARMDGDRLVFAAAEYGVAPGQAAVLYDATDESRVLGGGWIDRRSEEHTSELQSLMRISYAVFCLQK